MSRRLGLVGLIGGVAAIAVIAGTSVASAHGTGTVTIKIAIESNSNMADIEKLTPEFEKLNPGIKVDYDSLNENNERALVETDVTTHANEFNAVMISNYETPIWAKNGWLENLTPALTADASYDVNDLIKPIRDALSYKSGLYGVPFYGESSMVYYRKSLFKAAGLTMPLHPTWKQVAADAAKLKTSSTAGICLRGQNGWGENLAALDTVINTGGGSWFNTKWEPQFTNPATSAAVNFYVNLVRKSGEPGASQDGFTQCEALYGEGKAAMWYDATVAAGLIATAYPKVSADTGYAYAPTGSPTGAPGVKSGWLYTWSLSIPKGAPNQAGDAQVARVGDGEAVHRLQRPEGRLGEHRPRHAGVDVLAAPVQEGRRCVLRYHALVDQVREPQPPDRPERAGPVRRRAVRRRAMVHQPRHGGVEQHRGGDRRHPEREPGAVEEPVAGD